MLLKAHRWSRRALFAAAALPICQAAACDPTSQLLSIGAGFTNIVAVSLGQSLIQSAISVLLNTFPGSNLLRALLINAAFFPGL